MIYLMNLSSYLIPMEVEKIIYVTPWSLDKYPDADGTTGRLGDLSKHALAQLSNVISYVLKPEVSDKSLAYRTTSRLDSANDTISYIVNNFRDADGEDSHGHYVAHPENIEEVVASTQTAEVIVFWLTQTDLKEVMESLKNTWYDTVDAARIQYHNNIYVVSVDVKNLKAAFKEFPTPEDTTSPEGTI